MHAGTEEETKAFMAVCIETVEKYERQDVRTPVFVFERLCSIIYPEENDVGEFFLTLEKDPQQEDFLQVSAALVVHFQVLSVWAAGYKMHGGGAMQET
jgi:hypothetical protein